MLAMRRDLPPFTAAIENKFRRWQPTAIEIGPLMRHSHGLAPYAARGLELGELCEFGMGAVHYLRDPADEPRDWEKQPLARLTAIHDEKSLVRFSTLDPFRELVVSAGKPPSSIKQ
jgi:hypothetical protein